MRKEIPDNSISPEKTPGCSEERLEAVGDPPVFSRSEGREAPERETSPCPEEPESETVSAPEVGGAAETDPESAAEPDAEPDAEPVSEPVSEAKPEEKPRGFFGGIKERLTVWINALKSAVSERSAEVRHAKLKRILVFVAIGLVIAFFIGFYFAVGKKIALFINDAEAFREWLEGFGKSAIVIFVCLRVVQIVLKLIPGEALEIAAGCMFGTWEGLLWCFVGSVIGSFIIILLGRRYGIKLVGLFVSPEKMQSLSFLKDKKRLNFAFFLLYFIPGTPKDVFTWLVSLTDENAVLFVLITNLARIPSIVTSTWCGAMLVERNYLLSAAILGVTILLGIIGGLVYKFAAKKRSAEQNAAKK